MRQLGTVVIVTCEYPPFPGGIGTYSGRLAATLANDGHQAVVVCPHYEDDFDSCDTLGIEHHRILKHHGIPPRAIFRFLQILRQTPDNAVLLAADIRALLLIYLSWPLHRRRYRVMVHGSEANKFRNGSALFKIVRSAYLGAELVLYNSEATAKIFRDRVGVPARDKVTYLGVDDEWFSVPQSITFENEALAALPNKATVFCSVGRLEPRKGHLETIRGLAAARDQSAGFDPIYIVVGRAEDRDYAEAIAKEARILNVQTILTGRLSIEDVKRLYRRSAAHILYAQPLPGKVEGFGLVLLEAAAQQCPSIAARTGGIPEVLADTGLLVDPAAIKQLAAAALRVSNDPSVSLALGAAARERAKTFSWALCAARTFPSLYPDLAV